MLQSQGHVLQSGPAVLAAKVDQRQVIVGDGRIGAVLQALRNVAAASS